MKTRALGLLALVALSTGCATSYKARPPLSFQDFDYSSLDGKPWPLQRAALPETAATHRLASVPEVAYVELNPEGARTVLFIHGLGSYLKFWRYQLDAFAAQGYRVIAVDLPGYGKSDKPASFPYTMEAMGDAVHEFAQKLGVRQPILVGHSMGGQTSLSYALRYPEDVKAIVLTSPAGFEKFSAREKAWFKRSFSTALIKSSPEY
ncbi:MAG TPA: alpha/beta hydrolase, partial [Archangium sp.]|nr:alpha/beta hydrolase [Archangium sp.]